MKLLGRGKQVGLISGLGGNVGLLEGDLRWMLNASLNCVVGIRERACIG